MGPLSEPKDVMLLAVDVHYGERIAVVAGVEFADWGDAAPRRELVLAMEVPAAYTPGQFYQRELPCILRLLTHYQLQPGCMVIDGYVYLDGENRPGLGKHLFDALAGTVPVVGVAKSRFAGIGEQYAVYRGKSTRPLYVTAAGMGQETAKEHIRSMHGPHRLPTLLKRVDRLCRASLLPRRLP
ncbi:endonuclease V [Geotalea sp. SG265]|uniref:endonuclease V n=1 Tax=Geotalea sp. SG265 TaxID=2922867 RepID=UPI001FAE8B42|nr:endonuclease V [Geotalea sp. SG265]